MSLARTGQNDLGRQLQVHEVLSSLVTCAVAGATETAHASRPHSDTGEQIRRLGSARNSARLDNKGDVYQRQTADHVALPRSRHETTTFSYDPCLEKLTGLAISGIFSRASRIKIAISHVLVRDEWLERLRETATQYQDRALVSGNILNVDHLDKPDVETQQYAYTLKAWSVESAWHFHGHAKKTEPYLAPLCPAGLMFAKRSYFWDLGGFSERIKKWGGTDVEISLKNYMYGGENVVDPRVFVYHYYKNNTDRKPTFSISYKQTFFNGLFIAKAFCSEEVYENAQAWLAKKAKIGDFVAEVESEENQRHISR